MPSWLEAAVELRLGKIRAGLAQDLISLAQFTHLPLERLDPLLVRARWPGAKTLITLRLPHPVAQRLARAADLGCNRPDRLILRGVLVPVLENHPDRPLADLWGIRGCSLRHGSILSGVGASGNPGAVQAGTNTCGDRLFS